MIRVIKMAGPTADQIKAVLREMGRKGGRIGGKRRMESLSVSERSDLAVRAARARWGAHSRMGIGSGAAGSVAPNRLNDLRTLAEKLAADNRLAALRRQARKAEAQAQKDTADAAIVAQQARDEEVLRLRNKGRTLAEITKATGLSIGQVSKIVPRFIKLGSKRGPYNIKQRHGIVWPFNRSSEMPPLLAAINAAVPKVLREEIRQDICQNICVAVLSGEVALENIKDVVETFIRPAMRAGNDTSVLSLDYPFPSKGSAGAPIKEMIPSLVDGPEEEPEEAADAFDPRD